MKSRDFSSKTALCILLLVLVPAAVFVPSVIRDKFVNWDDEGQLYQNPDFNPPSVRSVAKYWYSSHMNLYMPITYTLWGSVAAVAQTPADAEGISLDPVWFHALNLVLHCAAVVAAFFVLRSLMGGDWPAFAGAMLFAVHPIQTEAVCWASGMYTVLSTLMIFLALQQYVMFLKGSGNRATLCYVAASLFMITAMLSKPSALVVIPMAAVLDLFVRRSAKKLIGPMVTWIVAAIPIVVVLYFTQPATIVRSAPIWFRPVVFFDSIGFYLVKVVLPVSFAADYGRSPTWLGAHWAAAWTALLPVVILAVGWMWRRRFPALIVGVSLFIAGLLPFLGLIKFDFQQFSTVADRYAYPAMLGIALLLAAAMDRWKSSAVKVVAIIALTGLAVRTYAQTTVWSDTRTLFTHNLAVNPGSLQANSNLGFQDMKLHHVDEAIAHYRAALETDPGDPDANTDLANALMSRGRFDEAIEHYHTALEVLPNDARIHLNLGSALANSGRYSEAFAEFQTALRDDGPNPDPETDVRAAAHANMGLILEKAGRTDNARAEYSAALSVDPDFGLARAGLVRMESGKK